MNFLETYIHEFERAVRLCELTDPDFHIPPEELAKMMTNVRLGVAEIAPLPFRLLVTTDVPEVVTDLIKWGLTNSKSKMEEHVREEVAEHLKTEAMKAKVREIVDRFAPLPKKME